MSRIIEKVLVVYLIGEARIRTMKTTVTSPKAA